MTPSGVGLDGGRPGRADGARGSTAATPMGNLGWSGRGNDSTKVPVLPVTMVRHLVYRTVGTYFGHALLTYREDYDLDHLLLLLGRVMAGAGGT